MIGRKLTAAVAASALALVAAPGAGASKPFVEPIDLEAGVIGGCAFDVGFEPLGTEYMRIFGSGRFTIHSYGSPTLTNLDSGSSVTYRLRYLFQERGGLGQISGRFLWTVVPGDVGPDGQVDPDGGLIHVVGQLRYVGDPDTFAITSLSVSGTVTDVCSALT